MNERESEIVYVIATASVNNKTIRCKPVFRTRELADQYKEESNIKGEIEDITLYK